MSSLARKWIFNIGLSSLLLITASGVHALGLGNLNLQSRLNQQFSASIPLSVAQDIDSTEIVVKLASREHFKRAGFKKTAIVLGLQFETRRGDDGKMLITVTSAARITEPMLNFVLEVGQGGARSLRNYTAMLEVPDK